MSQTINRFFHKGPLGSTSNDLLIYVRTFMEATACRTTHPINISVEVAQLSHSRTYRNESGILSHDSLDLVVGPSGVRSQHLVVQPGVGQLLGHVVEPERR